MNPQHFPSFEQSFTNVFKEMENAMEEMARTFGSIDIEIDQGWNNSQTPSLRDQMLKPGYSNHDEVHDRKKEDKDLDAALIPKENFEKLFNPLMVLLIFLTVQVQYSNPIVCKMFLSD